MTVTLLVAVLRKSEISLSLGRSVIVHLELRDNLVFARMMITFAYLF